MSTSSPGCDRLDACRSTARAVTTQEQRKVVDGEPREANNGVLGRLGDAYGVSRGGFSVRRCVTWKMPTEPSNEFWGGRSLVLPLLDPATGHIPPGRYATTLTEIQAEYVDAPRFQSSSTRSDIWAGFLAYLSAWRAAQDEAGRDVLLSLWIGGSFISSELHPSDIDVTPVVSKAVLDALHGAPGIGGLRSLFEHRAGVRQKFLVEPFVLLWAPMESTLFTESLDDETRAALAKHGGYDSFWQRVRPPGPKRAPARQTRFAERGYLEVVVQ
jgi:hypothetical protein